MNIATIIVDRMINEMTNDFAIVVGRINLSLS